MIYFLSKFNIFCLMIFLFLSRPIDAKVQIFACEPEWAALAEEIGKSHVNVYSATDEYQDPHYVKARPSLIAKVRKADVLFCTGADLEVGWLPVLLQKSGNSKIQPNQIGHFLAADFVVLKGNMKEVDRSMGDVHPNGNPHIHLNPYNISKIAKSFSKKLQEIQPKYANSFQQNEEIFLKKWQGSIVKWEKAAISLKKMKIITHHNTWFYLTDWLKVKVVDHIEVKAGIKPTAQHLQSLIKKARNQSIRAIIRTPYDSKKSSLWLSKKTNIPSTVISYTVGSKEKDLFALFDNILAKLLELQK